MWNYLVFFLGPETDAPAPLFPSPLDLNTPVKDLREDSVDGVLLLCALGGKNERKEAAAWNCLHCGNIHSFLSVISGFFPGRHWIRTYKIRVGGAD